MGRGAHPRQEPRVHPSQGGHSAALRQSQGLGAGNGERSRKGSTRHLPALPRDPDSTPAAECLGGRSGTKPGCPRQRRVRFSTGPSALLATGYGGVQGHGNGWPKMESDAESLPTWWGMARVHHLQPAWRNRNGSNNGYFQGRRPWWNPKSVPWVPQSDASSLPPIGSSLSTIYCN